MVKGGKNLNLVVSLKCYFLINYFVPSTSEVHIHNNIVEISDKKVNIDKLKLPFYGQRANTGQRRKCSFPAEVTWQD